MDFLNSFAKGSSDEKKAGDETSPSTTELFSSAKLLAEAAQGKATDNKKVAEAAADVLDAAQHYGKLDETQGIGQYVEKAETYLHKYGSPDPSVAAPAAEKPPAAVDTDEAKPPAPADKGVSEELKGDEKAPAAEGKEKGEGYGQYVEMAEGFLKKQSGGEAKPDGEGGNSGPDYLKMAGSFFNK